MLEKNKVNDSERDLFSCYSFNFIPAAWILVAVALGLVLEAINAFTLAIYPTFPLKTCTSPVIIRAQRLVLVAATYRLRELVRLALILLTAAPLGARA